jgi:SAM-dependent methyltransferase
MPGKGLEQSKAGSLENFVIHVIGNTMPIAVLKRLPTLYYRINRYRFRLFARPVMVKETSKAKERRKAEGFFDRYFAGQGIDVGYGGDLVVPNCRGWDVEDGDAHELAGIPDASFDFVYSSHILEHLEDPARAVKNWWRVLKPGGYLILYVPERDLFERKKTLPSDISLDHKHFILLDRDDPPDTIGLIPLLKNNLDGVELVYQRICSAGYDANVPVSFMSDAEYSIELVARKGGP